NRRVSRLASAAQVGIDALRLIGEPSVLILPLIAHQQVLGVVVLASSAHTRAYSPELVRTAEDLAARAASGLNHLRLHREAEGAIKTREEVLAVVAHDLRNSLNTIRAASELMCDQTESLGIRERTASCIMRTVDSMERMLSDLVDLAVIDSGRLTLTPSRC